MANRTYRLTEIRFVNHNEFWIEKSIRLFWIHIRWERTTISYFSKKESAEKHLEDILGIKLKINKTI